MTYHSSRFIELLFQCFCVFNGVGVVIVIEISIDCFLAFEVILEPFSPVAQSGFGIIARIFARRAVKANVNDIARNHTRCRNTNQIVNTKCGVKFL